MPRDWKLALDKISRALADRAAAKFGADSRVLTVRNADDTVDSEVRIMVPRGVHERSIVMWLSQVTRQAVKLPKSNDVWMAIGGRYEPNAITDDSLRDEYVTHFGLLEIATYYRRTRYRGEHMVTALQTTDEMRQKWGRKAREIVLRLTYDTTRPERKGKLVAKRKRKKKARKRAKKKGKRK